MRALTGNVCDVIGMNIEWDDMRCINQTFLLRNYFAPALRGGDRK